VASIDALTEELNKAEMENGALKVKDISGSLL